MEVFISTKKAKLDPWQWEDSTLRPLCLQAISGCLKPLRPDNPSLKATRTKYIGIPCLLHFKQLYVFNENAFLCISHILSFK